MKSTSLLYKYAYINAGIKYKLGLSIDVCPTSPIHHGEKAYTAVAKVEGIFVDLVICR